MHAMHSPLLSLPWSFFLEGVQGDTAAAAAERLRDTLPELSSQRGRQTLSHERELHRL